MMVNLSVHIRISFKINHVIARDKLLSLVFGRFSVTIFSLQPYNLYKIFKIVQSRTGFLRVADPSGKEDSRRLVNFCSLSVYCRSIKDYQKWSKI